MIAIDFGTTNSSVVVFSEGDAVPRLQKLELDPESYDANVMPSALCSCSSAQCASEPETYGHVALRHHFEQSHDSKLLQEMKLYFDKSTQDPPTLGDPKKIVALREEDGFLTPVLRSYKYSRYEGDVPLKPSEFVPGTAELVKELIKRSQAENEDRQEIAVGVPASFHELGKRRLREAVKRGAFGDAAGYQGVRLFYEPIAAARSYRDIGKGNILVLDYGGGTLDITVVTVEQKARLDLSRVVFGGFPEAGSKMDDAILKYCLSRATVAVQDWYEAQPIKTRLLVKRKVEKAKILLSTQEETTIELPGSGFDPIHRRGSVVCAPADYDTNGGKGDPDSDEGHRWH